jgi:uncharacterized protein (TIGR02266 family)
MSAEQRKHPRQPLQVDFKARDGRGEGQLLFEGTDLSPGGSFLRSELLLEQGEALTVEFRIPGTARQIQAPARVAWVRRFPKGDEQAGMGIEFLSMAEADRELLRRYLAT